MKASPENRADVQKAISELLSDKVALYVRRALSTRESAENDQGEQSFVRSSPRPGSLPTAPRSPAVRNSAGPSRPNSLTVDKTSSADDQIAQYKTLFNRNAGIAGMGKGSPDSGYSGQSGSDRSGDAPLREIALQQRLVRRSSEGKSRRSTPSPAGRKSPSGLRI